jgi:chemotaxis protein methyltransferase CheR
MTTNESLFFRDVKPFEQFRRLVLPRLLEARAHTRQIRVWSAACSSGQESYSLAMVLAEEGSRLQGWKLDLLGTDISKAMVERARAGSYSQFEVQRGVPPALLKKYFEADGERWKIASALRPMTRFREFNLLDDPAPLGQFDVVFCRNVLIYFDQPTKAKILAQIARRMPADGLLYLGGSETVFGITDQFEPVPGERGVYGLSRAALGAVAQPVRAAA